jgi:hypothetical protein
MPENSAAQRPWLPKSRSIARPSAAEGWAFWPKLSKYVKDHGVPGEQLLALQAVDPVAGRRRRIEGRELGGNLVQPVHRPDIVIVVVADEQFLRKTRHVPQVGRLGRKPPLR